MILIALWWDDYTTLSKYKNSWRRIEMIYWSYIWNRIFLIQKKYHVFVCNFFLIRICIKKRKNYGSARTTTTWHCCRRVFAAAWVVTHSQNSSNTSPSPGEPFAWGLELNKEMLKWILKFIWTWCKQKR